MGAHVVDDAFQGLGVVHQLLQGGIAVVALLQLRIGLHRVGQRP